MATCSRGPWNNLVMRTWPGSVAWLHTPDVKLQNQFFLALKQDSTHNKDNKMWQFFHGLNF